MNIPAVAQERALYFFHQDISKLYLSIAIRNFALGMVILFEPIYLYQYFQNSLSLTLFYFAAIYGLYASIAVLGGKILSTLGPARSMLVSFGVYLSYYILLLLFPYSAWYVAAAVAVGAAGMLFFWPAFHTDFTRVSSQEYRGRAVGRISLTLLPVIAGPAVGGLIVTNLGYSGLFTAVLVALLAASIPLLYAKQSRERYVDSYGKVWKKIREFTRLREKAAYAANGVEISIHHLVWPLFLFGSAVSFSEMGALTSAALIASSLFMLYIGRLSDTEDRTWLLNVGSLWTAMSWVLKYFVTGPFDALLAHMVYRTSRAAAGVPFQTFFYEKAAGQDQEADEYIIFREILINAARFLFFGGLGIFFFLFPTIGLNVVFLAAAVFSLGFVLQGRLPEIKLRNII